MLLVRGGKHLLIGSMPIDWFKSLLLTEAPPDRDQTHWVAFEC